jgi:hypothetical protein
MASSWQKASISSVVTPGAIRVPSKARTVGGFPAGAAHALDDVG